MLSDLKNLCSFEHLNRKFSNLKVLSSEGNTIVLSGVDNSTAALLENGESSQFVGSKVALKRLSLVGKIQCRVALRELSLLKRFQHENIVKILKIIDSYGRTIEDPSIKGKPTVDSVFVVEELLNSDLYKILERNVRIPFEIAKLFLYQLLRALKYIHSANVIHRDIKPGNLFIKEDDLTLKVGDFGLARVFENRYKHKGYLTALVTTRYYRAPEVMLNVSDYSYPIDIWSAGCVFSEMLLGNVMFPGENDLDQISCISNIFGLTPETLYNEKGVFPTHLFSDFSTQVVDLLSKMLAINAETRITAAEALHHPLFAELHDPNDEPSCLQPFYIEHEIDNLPTKILKRKVLRNSCFTTFENKSYHSSEESLFKDFDENLNDDRTHKPLSHEVNDNCCNNYIDSSYDPLQIPLKKLVLEDSFLPTLDDVVSRDDIDTPYRDPGVCERKYHDVQDVDSCFAKNYFDASYKRPQQQVSYYSDLSPVIETNDGFDAKSSHSFLEVHGRCCASKIHSYRNEKNISYFIISF